MEFDIYRYFSALRKGFLKFLKTGADDKEKYLNEDGQEIVKIDKRYYRHAEVHELLGDPTLAKEELGWRPKGSFESLVKKMYNNDYNKDS